ncbi:hypothetical protein M8Q35_24720, partial [Enterobacter hormaechei]|nr:hypothetical protein [Enterobacter hormaechei]
MMSLWDALRMNMMISYQELVRTFPNNSFMLLRGTDISFSIYPAPDKKMSHAFKRVKNFLYLINANIARA